MRRLLIMSMLVLVSWGCTPAPEAIAPEATAPTTKDILNGEWILKEMNGESLAESTASLEFNNGQAAGISFCNNYSTTITVEGNELTFDSAIAATKMMCPEGDAMQREQMYFEALTKVKTYAEVEGRLELRDETGTPLLVYLR